LVSSCSMNLDLFHCRRSPTMTWASDCLIKGILYYSFIVRILQCYVPSPTSP
jgi:hypothetical protein